MPLHLAFGINGIEEFPGTHRKPLSLSLFKGKLMKLLAEVSLFSLLFLIQHGEYSGTLLKCFLLKFNLAVLEKNEFYLKKLINIYSNMRKIYFALSINSR